MAPTISPASKATTIAMRPLVVVLPDLVARITLASTMTPPIDRSKPPEMITSVRPVAATTSGAALLSSSAVCETVSTSTDEYM